MVNIQSVESFQVTSTLPKSSKLTRNPPPPLTLKRKGIDIESNKECKDKRKKEEVEVNVVITGSNRKSLKKKRYYKNK